MVKVLHVIDNLGSGGSERQLAITVLNSDRRRFAHTVCVLGGGGRYLGALRDARIPVVLFHRQPRHSPIGTLRDLLGVIRTVNPDIVHTSLYWSDVLGRLAARVTGRPAVTTLVNTTYEGDWLRDASRFTRVKVALFRGLDGQTARRCGTWFVGVTETVRASGIRSLGIPPGRTSVIYRGVSFEELTAPTTDAIAAVRRDLGWEGHSPVLLSVGRLVLQKGHRYAVEALPAVLSAFPRTRLAIAGEGPLAGELVRLARSLGVEEHLQLLGERHDVPELLAAADLFVFPSVYEGFGGALMEAMAAGKPCVLTAFAGAAELTDGGRVARVVRPGASGQIAAAIIDLVRHPEQARELGAAAQVWARRFDVATAVRAIEELYERIHREHRHDHRPRVGMGAPSAAGAVASGESAAGESTAAGLVAGEAEAPGAV